MKTFILMSLSCMEKPHWWHQGVLKKPLTCTCKTREMRRTVICTVRAEDVKKAAVMLYGSAEEFDYQADAQTDQVENGIVYGFHGNTNVPRRLVTAYATAFAVRLGALDLQKHQGYTVQFPFTPRVFKTECDEHAYLDHLAKERGLRVIQSGLQQMISRGEMYLMEVPEFIPPQADQDAAATDAVQPQPTMSHVTPTGIVKEA